jgi:hypothetical protein
MHKDGEPLYIDSQSMLANKSGMQAVGIAMDLVCLLWWPTKSPFVFEPKAIAECFHESLPARGYTEEILREHAQSAMTFFTVLPDGRWTPSPIYFSATDGNPGSQS